MNPDSQPPIPASSGTELAPAPLFSDHAVLQRGVPVPVWGIAAPGEEVTVTFAGQAVRATTDTEGRWQATLEPISDGAAGSLEIAGAGKTFTFMDVVAGEVWLCSGQSNMELCLPDSVDGSAVAAAANHPQIRQFNVPFKTSDTLLPSEAVASSWKVCTPDNAKSFTAVGYYFARDLSARLGGVPVGIIRSARGNTPIQPWIPISALGPDPLHDKWLAYKKEQLVDWPAQKKAMEDAYELWDRQVAEAKAAGKEPPGRPWFAGAPDQPAYMPAKIYNAMVHPLVPYALRGILWYQGESNASFGAEGANDYSRLQSLLVSAWRNAWEQPGLPFYFVQLPNFYRDQKVDPRGTGWALFREGQAKAAAAIPNIGFVVTIDIGDEKEIHPPNKQDVGLRLALLAAARTYGQDVIASGPTLESGTPSDGAMVLSFANIGSGLALREPCDAPGGFEIAGADRIFHPADARIEGSCIRLSSAQVPDPVAARYAWTNAPKAKLFNREGLPGAPFRTDDWAE